MIYITILIQCIILSIIFTFIILIPLYKNPIRQITSYPPEIRKAIESLPMYKDTIKHREKKHILIKILFVLILPLILGIVAHLSGAETFFEIFKHVFILFFFVNIYDLVVIYLLIFRNVKAFRIPCTEDMDKEYKKPRHHIRGAFIGTIICIVVALLSATYMLIFNMLQFYNDLLLL